MAIALQPKFPIPDRSNQPVRSVKDEDGVIDIGWCEGILSDGRAFRAEMWAQDQISSLTLFFSAIGLETLEQDEMKDFVEKEGLVTFKKSGPNYCQAMLFQDNGGNQVWSVNIVVGDENETFIDNSIPVFPYSRVGEPNTIFNPVPIKMAYQITDPKRLSPAIFDPDEYETDLMIKTLKRRKAEREAKDK